MNLKHYTTPAIVAAAAHAALFLLAPDVPAISRPTNLGPVVIGDPPHPDNPSRQEFDHEPIDDDYGLTHPAESPPRLSELVSVMECSFTMPMPPTITRDVERTSDIFRIDPNYRRPTGSGEGPGGGGHRAINFSDLDREPRYRARTAPDYPFSARQAGQEGEVLLDFLVNEQGRVVSVRVLSSTDRLFEEPAMRAVRNWRFEPGRRDGRVVAFRMTVPLVFRLSDGQD